MDRYDPERDLELDAQEEKEKKQGKSEQKEQTQKSPNVTSLFEAFARATPSQSPLDPNLFDVVSTSPNGELMGKMKSILSERKRKEPEPTSKLNAFAPEFIPFAFRKIQQEEREIQEENKRQKSNPDPLITAPWLGEQLPNSLHEEILAFTQWVSPRQEELFARQQVIKEIQELLKEYWKQTKLHVFGSTEYGLSLPNSDIDLVIEQTSTKKLSVKKCLQKLKQLIQTKKPDMAQNIVAIPAKVPIVKFVHRVTGLGVDVSFDQMNGPRNTNAVKRYLKEMPLLRPLVLVLKSFLQERKLNEVHKGGLGSYALILQVLSFLQTHAMNRGTETKIEDLGELLIDFFELYGIKFNYWKAGISVKERGYFPKASKGWVNQQKPFLFSAEDPEDDSNDVGAKSFAILSVRAAYANAYYSLKAQEFPSPTLLTRIIKGDPLIEEYRAQIKHYFQPFPKIKKFP